MYIVYSCFKFLLYFFVIESIRVDARVFAFGRCVDSFNCKCELFACIVAFWFSTFDLVCQRSTPLLHQYLIVEKRKMHDGRSSWRPDFDTSVYCTHTHTKPYLTSQNVGIRFFVQMKSAVTLPAPSANHRFRIFFNLKLTSSDLKSDAIIWMFGCLWLEKLLFSWFWEWKLMNRSISRGKMPVPLSSPHKHAQQLSFKHAQSIYSFWSSVFLERKKGRV